MAQYDFLVSTGLIVPETGDLRSEVEAEFREALGQDLIMVPTTPQGRLIEAETAARSGTMTTCADVANQINPNEATGNFLLSICALSGIDPKAAKPSVLPSVVLTGVIGSYVPAGSRAQVNAQLVFQSVNPVTLVDDGTGKGKATVDFVCTVNGPTVVTPDTLTTIVDLVPGWQTVNNPNSAIPGQNALNDSQLRAYRNQMLCSYGSNSVGATVSNIVSLPGVNSMTIRENDDSVEKVIDGITMPPNSIWICVDGGSDGDIARAYLASKSGGSKMTEANRGASVVSEIKDYYSGQKYRAVFTRPDKIQTTCRITVTTTSSLRDLSAAVREAIQKYISGDIAGEPGLVIGAGLSPFEISGAVMKEVPGVFVRNCLVAVLGQPEKPETVPIALWEKAMLPPSSITVIVE